MAVYLVCAIAALAGLLFGFDTGIISGALLFIEKSFPLTTFMKELLVSSVLLGAMAGSLSGGRLTDHYGRRRIILIISGVFTLGTLIASLAPNVQTILFGRLCIGFAIGIGSYTAPLYIAEIAPQNLRGGLVSLNQLAITIGIMCSYIINYVFTNTEGSWRLMFAIGLIPAILLGIGMIFLPESPRWLAKQKRHDEAEKTLQYLRRKTNVSHELNDIEKSLGVREAKLSEVFTAWIRPVLFLGIMLGFLQQVTGINTIIYYAPTIFQLAGFYDTSSSILATVGIGVVNVIATIFAVYYLDKLGRRALLLTGLVGMCISLIALSLVFQWDSSYIRWAAVISTFVYVICFAFSLGAMLWLLVSEIFPLEVRGTAMSVAVFSCWLWNFAVSATFLTLLNELGPTNTFLLYAVMCVVGFVFCYYKVPETKDISLEKIEENIRNGLPLREIGQPVLTLDALSDTVSN
jgi:SP family galactose:H+ symporter-like MFS transporter